MKIAFKEHKHSWFIVFCLAAILAIVACNLWLLCYGHCALNDYLRIPTIGWTLIVANLAAGLILLAVKCHNATKSGGDFCGVCRIGLRDIWVYCPNCGGER